MFPFDNVIMKMSTIKGFFRNSSFVRTKRTNERNGRQHKKDPSDALFHDDVIKWKYFPRYWLFVSGIHWSQRPVTRSFVAFFDLKCCSFNQAEMWFNTQVLTIDSFVFNHVSFQFKLLLKGVVYKFLLCRKTQNGSVDIHANVAFAASFGCGIFLPLSLLRQFIVHYENVQSRKKL